MNLHLGFDPGLRRGALVSAVSQIKGSQLIIEHWNVLYSWDDRIIGKKSTPAELSEFIHSRILPKVEGPVISVTVEWDPNSIYWRAQRLQVVVTSFLIGYFTRGVQSLGIPVHYLMPHQLKRIFAISPKEKKEYMQRPLESPLIPEIISAQGFPENPDEYDALLLAITPTLRTYDPVAFSTLLFSK